MVDIRIPGDSAAPSACEVDFIAAEDSVHGPLGIEDNTSSRAALGARLDH